MSSLRSWLKQVDWQMSWLNWVRPHYVDHYIDGYEHVGIDNLYMRYFFIGPLQTRWYITREPLKRSPLWNEKMKELLLKDLRESNM